MNTTAKTTLLAAAALAFSLTTTSGAWAGCDDPAAPGVDWSGCDKTGFRMHRAPLGNAQLRGTILIDAHLFDAYLVDANLIGADLTDANLDLADLSYADLQGAVLLGARMRSARLGGAKLTGAMWTDGRICGHNSVGECRQLYE